MEPPEGDALRSSGLLVPIAVESASVSPNLPRSAPWDIQRPYAPPIHPVPGGSPELRGRITGEPRPRGGIPISNTVTGFVGRNEVPTPHQPSSMSPRQIHLTNSNVNSKGERLGKTQSEEKEKIPKSQTTQGLVRGGSDSRFNINRSSPPINSPRRGNSPRKVFTPLIVDNRTHKGGEKNLELERTSTSPPRCVEPLALARIGRGEQNDPITERESISPPRGIDPKALPKRRGSNDKGVGETPPSSPSTKKASSTNLSGSPKSGSPLRVFGTIVNTIAEYTLDPFKRGSMQIILPDEDEIFGEFQKLGTSQPCDISHEAFAIINDFDKSDNARKTLDDFDDEFYTILNNTFGYFPLQQTNKIEIIQRWLNQQAFRGTQNILCLAELIKVSSVTLHIQHRLDKISKQVYAIYANDSSKKTVPDFDAMLCSQDFKTNPFSVIDYLYKSKNQMMMRVFAKMMGGAALLGRYYLINKYYQIANELNKLNQKVLGVCKQDVKDIDNITWSEVVRQLMPDGKGPIINIKIGNDTVKFEGDSKEKDDINRFIYFRSLLQQFNSFLNLHEDPNILAFRLTHEYKHPREATLKVEESIQKTHKGGSRIKDIQGTYIWRLVELLKNDMQTRLELIHKIIESRLYKTLDLEVVRSICKDVICNWKELKDCILRLKKYAANNAEFQRRLEKFQKFQDTFTIETPITSIVNFIKELQELMVPKELYSEVKYKGSFIKKFEQRLFSYHEVIKTANMALLVNIRVKFIPEIWPELLPKLEEDYCPSSSMKVDGELLLEMNNFRNGTHRCEILKRNNNIVTIQYTSATITYYQALHEKIKDGIVQEKIKAGTIHLRYETERVEDEPEAYYESKLFIDKIELNEDLMGRAEGHRIRLLLIEKLLKPLASPRPHEGIPLRT